MATEMVYVERKFVLDGRPRVLGRLKGAKIKQGYIGDLRLRNCEGVFSLAVRTQVNGSRSFWQQEVPAWVFSLIWERTDPRQRIEKTRYLYKGCRVDVFEGRHKGLVMLECDFPNQNSARSFSLPFWAKGHEVTDDDNYSNKVLAFDGLP